MNKKIDTKTILTLRETADGHDLYINHDKQKIIIEDGEIKNKLKAYQLKFVKDYIKL